MILNVMLVEVVILKDVLITVFSLGLLSPVADLMIYKYILEYLELNGEFDFDKVNQIEKTYNNAAE